ncbi:DNA repair protein RAD57 [Poronia punctata]|nr:DNA repair protein RAD57 [Poronia punctata]
MTDLSQVLPDFPTARYARLLPAIEKSKITVADLLTLEVPEIGKRTQLPLLDIKRLCDAVSAALRADLAGPALRRTGAELVVARPWRTISTLDGPLDAALAGGIPTGYITEITGESGVGKTQFLLTLLLSAQLPPPHGLGRPSLYISTEAALSTKRLAQILSSHPFFRDDDDAGIKTKTKTKTKPSLDRVISTVTPDLESQDHILTYQVPVEVARRNIGLIVLDSVAANFRAEFERGGSGSNNNNNNNNMAARGAELVRLGYLLRELARKHDLAVVVANQVADRFSSDPSSSVPSSFASQTKTPLKRVHHHHHYQGLSQESPLASRSRKFPMNPPKTDNNNNNNNNTDVVEEEEEEEEEEPSSSDIMVRSSMPEPRPEDFTPAPPPALSLDHQQRWFTGWGDDPYGSEPLKTPSLGLVWSTQIAVRIALFRRPVVGRKERLSLLAVDDDETETTEGPIIIKSWQRYMKVVFAPHVPGAGPGLRDAVEFDVVAAGVRGKEKKKKEEGEEEEEGRG